LNKWQQIAQLFLGLGAEVLPIFVHNPKSQKISAIILTDAAQVIGDLNQAAGDTSTQKQ